jgi:L-cystine transport system permease protein
VRIDGEFIFEVFKKCWTGLPKNFEIIFFTLMIAIPLGLIAAIVCHNKVPFVSQVLKVLVSFIRSTPPILLILITYYGAPALLMTFLEPETVYQVDPLIYAIIIFSVIEIALLTEVFRSSLMAVPDSQLEAAESIGMTKFQGYRRIVIPQVLVGALPVLCSSVTDLVKMTSLAFALTVVDVMAIGKIEGGLSLAFMEAYLAVSMVYLIVVFAVEQVFKLFERLAKSYG